MRKLMFGLAALALLLAAGRALPEDEAANGPAVLVVDLNRVLKECDEARAEVAKLEAEASVKKEEFAKEKAQLEMQRKELMDKTALSERDANWYEQLEASAREEGKLQARALRFNVTMNDRIARKMDDLMKLAREVADKVRKQRGSILVLASKMGDIKFENERELENEQLFRRVLCADASADITDDVIAGMNKWWADNKPVTPKGQ